MDGVLITAERVAVIRTSVRVARCNRGPLEVVLRKVVQRAVKAFVFVGVFE
jgi:hypothetical protein